MIARHQDRLAAEELGGLFSIGQRRHVAGRMDAPDVAGQDEEIDRPDERPQVRPEPKRTGFAPGTRLVALPNFDMGIAEIQDSDH